MPFIIKLFFAIGGSENDEDKKKELIQVEVLPKKLDEEVASLMVQGFGGVVTRLTEEQADFLMNMVGGEKAYKSMLDWASENFSKHEVNMYDNVMASGNANAIFFAVQALQARYGEGVGTDGETLTGRGAGSADDSFQSQAELVAAMNDPRYDRDPAYRADVFEKLDRSNLQF